MKLSSICNTLDLHANTSQTVVSPVTRRTQALINEMTGEITLSREMKLKIFADIQGQIDTMHKLIVDTPNQYRDVDAVLNVWSNLLELYFAMKGKQNV